MSALLAGLRALPGVQEVGWADAVPTDSCSGIRLGEGAEGVLVVALHGCRLSPAEEGFLGELARGVLIREARRVGAVEELAHEREAAAVLRAWARRARSTADDLRAALGHDFRTPLAVVEGQCELIREGIATAAQLPRLLESILKQTGRMEVGLSEQAGTLGDLLEGPPSERVSLAALVDLLAARGRREALARGVMFTQPVPDATQLTVGPAFVYAAGLALSAMLGWVERGLEVELRTGQEGGQVWLEICRRGAELVRGSASGGLASAARLLAEVGGLVTLEQGGMRVRLSDRPPGSSLPVGGAGKRDRTTGWVDPSRAELCLREMLSGSAAGPLPVFSVVVRGRASVLRAQGDVAAERVMEWVAGEILFRAPVGSVPLRASVDSLAVVAPAHPPEVFSALMAEVDALGARCRPRIGLGRVQLRVATAVFDLKQLGVGEVLARLTGSPERGGTEALHGT